MVQSSSMSTPTRPISCLPTPSHKQARCVCFDFFRLSGDFSSLGVDHFCGDKTTCAFVLFWTARAVFVYTRPAWFLTCSTLAVPSQPRRVGLRSGSDRAWFFLESFGVPPDLILRARGGRPGFVVPGWCCIFGLQGAATGFGLD